MQSLEVSNLQAWGEKTRDVRTEERNQTQEKRYEVIEVHHIDDVFGDFNLIRGLNDEVVVDRGVDDVAYPWDEGLSRGVSTRCIITARIVDLRINNVQPTCHFHSHHLPSRLCACLRKVWRTTASGWERPKGMSRLSHVVSG